MLNNFFNGSPYQVDAFRFADGFTLAATQVMELGNMINGAGGNDIL